MLNTEETLVDTSQDMKGGVNACVHQALLCLKTNKSGITFLEKKIH